MILNFLKWLFTPTPAPVEASPIDAPREAFFTTEGIDRDAGLLTRDQRIAEFSRRAIPKTIDDVAVINDGGTRGGYAMDANNAQNSLKSIFSLTQVGIPDVQANWYGSQGFIGYQLCALIAQHWLVNKACAMPARDAIRKGYKFTANDGTVITPKMLDAINKANKRFKLNRNLVQFVTMGRVFGIRIALCVVDHADPEYYVKPFNADSITPGSYKGITQIDPYWVVPELTEGGASDPAAIDFYEPTYWVIGGTRYHKSHLVIMRGPEVADILKPSYLYGGISVPQMIYERVYASERTANEAPLLALTKRTTVFYTDVGKALANQAKFENNLARWIGWRDNQAVKVADKVDDQIDQHDTSLADLDAVIMTQYQLVAAVANIPATKLLGTTPKGFNSSGGYEEDSYHEELETIQVNDMEPLIDRHMACMIRSVIAPRFNVRPFAVDCTWEPLDSLSTREAAEVNKIKAETDKILAVDIGAVDGAEVRARVSSDEMSGHNGLPTLTDLDNVQETETDGEA